MTADDVRAHGTWETSFKFVPFAVPVDLQYFIVFASKSAGAKGMTDHEKEMAPAIETELQRIISVPRN